MTSIAASRVLSSLEVVTLSRQPWRRVISSGSLAAKSCGRQTSWQFATSRRSVSTLLEFPWGQQDGPVVSVLPGTSIEDVAALAIKNVTAGACVDDDLGCAIAMFDLGVLRARFELWSRNLPDIKPYYAMKCNPDPEIVRKLATLGANFDCASKAEMECVLALGVDPQRILFANPCKFRSHLRFAREAGVTMMTFDNENELYKVKEVYGTDAELVLRLRVEDTGSWCPMGEKFGAEGRETLESLLQTAENLGLQLKGISFHVGSGSSAAGNFTKALADAKAVFDIGKQKYPNTHGRTMTVLDIGGGFPGDDADNQFGRVVSEIRTGLADMEYLNLKVIAEPGRFFATQCTTLVTEIFGVTQPRSTAAAGIGSDAAESPAAFHYSVSDGVYGSFGDLVYYPESTKLATPTPLLRKELDSRAQSAMLSGSPPSCKSSASPVDTYPSLLFGPTCDGIDTLGVYPLPQMRERDYLLWRDMGAYTQAAETTFNGIPAPTRWYFERTTANASGGGGAAVAGMVPRQPDTMATEAHPWGSWAALGVMLASIGLIPSQARGNVLNETDIE